ncbi:MAG: hypothetical protein N4A41_12665 [Crocinitomicaceae bacterium]|jgi:hypothetical protein|nr:hypothetical protein [Crocinitomicaceae bacterium]
MKRLVILSGLFLISCKQEAADVSGAEDVASLKSEIEQLKLESSLKDSAINESLLFFNEIKSNLEAINVKKEGLQRMSNNPESANYDKEWMLEEIKHINYLREENAKKVGQLQNQLKEKGVNISELSKLIASLQEDIKARDGEIAVLQDQLAQKDIAYAQLFDAYQVKEFDLDAAIYDLNKAYYVYGSEKELVDNGVLEKKNGFLGIGKKVSMNKDLNDQYFTEIDLRNKKEINIIGSKPKIISVHPLDSYSLQMSGGSNKLVIKNPSEFWKVSKYLVVCVQ